MCSHLAKRVFSSQFHFHFPSYQHHLLLLDPLLRFSLSTQTQPQKDLPFIADYLTSSLGFSADRALKYSINRNLAAIKSPDGPNAVIKFLKDTGLSDPQVKAAVSFHPILLSNNVDKTLKPRVRELVENGFSGDLLVQLIRYNPVVLCLKGTLSRLLFWRDFLGGSDDALLKIIPKSSLLFALDIDKHVVPVINLLKEYELSNRDIVSLLWSTSRCITRSPDSLRLTLELIEELGILRGSKMFLRAVKAVGGCSKDTMKSNAEFFKRTYGWSQEEVLSAFRKFPQFLCSSEDKLRSTINFLIRKAGYDAKCIALQPRLLGSSLDRVLIPRYAVLSALEAKGLKKKCSLHSACLMSERRFRETYVVGNEKDVPGLGEAYAAAYGEKLQV